MKIEKPERSKFALDEFLTAQAKAAILGTIEAVEGDSGKVKVTPWQAHGGCMCHAAMILPKDAIASVSPTGDSHVCCGKTLKVVEIELAENSTMAVSQVMAQMLEKASEHHQQSAEHLGAPSFDPHFFSGNVPAGMLQNFLQHLGATREIAEMAFPTPVCGVPGGCGTQQCCYNPVYKKWCCRPNCYTGSPCI